MSDTDAGPNAEQIEFWNGPAAEKWVDFNAELDELYVTSAGGPVEGATDPSPDAGALFRIRGLGVTGLPETRFAG